jgi:hypothetical protein
VNTASNNLNSHRGSAFEWHGRLVLNKARYIFLRPALRSGIDMSDVRAKRCVKSWYLAETVKVWLDGEKPLEVLFEGHRCDFEVLTVPRHLLQL